MRSEDRIRAEEMNKWAAVKSPLGAQTVLGRIFQRLARKRMRDESEKRSSENLIRSLGQRNDLNPGEFASRAGVCVGEAQHV